jgi:hypothetical protein
LLDFLAVLDVGTNSGLRALDVRGNPSLADLLTHKKFGAAYTSKLALVYLEFKFDRSKKK